MIGRKLGHYEILSQLGAGGMGVVFVARDDRLGRKVALKVLPPSMAGDPELLARFQREAKALAALRHPGIVTIHSIEEHDGVHFLTMELVDGQPLSQCIPEHGMDPRRWIEIAVPLAAAVGAAHSQGVTHRDLKPANIMIDGADVKVLDFGLAKQSGTLRSGANGTGEAPVPGDDAADTLPTSDFTKLGRILGTVHYMSPEQAEGKPVGPPSDVFALGIVLYEMATGEKPFRGATPISILSSILRDDPPLVTLRNPSMPHGLDRIVRRCLQKHSAERYRDANLLRDDLERLREEIQAVSRIDAASRIDGPSKNDAASEGYAASKNDGAKVVTPPPKRTADFVMEGTSRPGSHERSLLSRRRLPLFLAALLGISLLAFIALRFRTDEGARAAVGASGRPSIAVFEFRTHGADEQIRWLASGVPSLLLTGLAQTPGLDVVSSARIEEILSKIGKEEAERIDQSILSEVARRSGAGAVILGNIFKSGESIRIDVQVEDVQTGRLLFAREASGSDVYSIVDQLALGIREGLDLTAAVDERSVAEVSSGSLDAYRAYDEGVKALNSYRLADATRLLEKAVILDPEFAMAHAKIAELARYQRDLEAERRHLERAFELSGRLPERQRALVEAQYQIFLQRDPESARGTLEGLIAKFPGEAEAYLMLSSEIVQRGDGAAALEILRRGVESVPASGPLRNQYAYLLRRAGRPDEAIRELEMYQALEPEEVNPRDSMAEIYLTSGRPREALQKYEEVLNLDPTFETAHRGRALALAVLGRFPEAVQAFDQSLSLIEKAGLSPRALYSSKAILLLQIGRYREALDLAERDDGEFVAQGFDSPGYHVRLIQMLRSMRCHEYATCAQASKEVMERWPPEAPDIFRRAMQGVALQHQGISEARQGNVNKASAIRDEEAVTLGPDPLAPWAADWIAGEIALSTGDLDAAEAAFLRGGPTRAVGFTNSQLGLTGSLALNHPPSRDWKARLLAARGDVDGAIAAYRELNSTHGPFFTAMYEPLYVLAIARLLDQKGDREAARREYENFLGLWESADEGLPEKEEAERYLRAAG